MKSLLLMPVYAASHNSVDCYSFNQPIKHFMTTTVNELDGVIQRLYEQTRDMQRQSTLFLNRLQRATQPFMLLTYDGTIHFYTPAVAAWLPEVKQGSPLVRYLGLGKYTAPYNEWLRLCIAAPDQFHQVTLTGNDEAVVLAGRAVALTDTPLILIYLAGEEAASNLSALPMATSAPRPAGSLPTDRRLTGRDFETLAKRLGKGKSDIKRLLGIPVQNWNRIRSAKFKDEPISEAAIVLLMRLFDAYPDLANSRYQFTDFKDLLSAVLERPIHNTDADRFLGQAKSAGFRWEKQGIQPRPPTQALVDTLCRVLADFPPDVWETYLQFLELEQALRDGSADR